MVEPAVSNICAITSRKRPYSGEIVARYLPDHKWGILIAIGLGKSFYPQALVDVTALDFQCETRQKLDFPRGEQRVCHSLHLLKRHGVQP
jgi:hypothetical protein